MRRLGADLVLEHLLAGVKGQHRGGVVAAQVMQPHDTAVGVFGQRLGLQQLLCQRQRGGGVAGGFQALDLRFKRVARLRMLGAALLRQPGLELRAVWHRQAGQQLGGGVQVMRHPRGQGERGAARHQVPIQLFAQPEEPLAQGVAGRFSAALGPKQLGQTLARSRAFQRQPGQQQGVGGGQRLGAPVAHGGGGRAGELEQHLWGRHGMQDSRSTGDARIAPIRRARRVRRW